MTEDQTDRMTIQQWLEQASKFDRVCHAIGFVAICMAAALLFLTAVLCFYIGLIDIVRSLLR